MNSKKPNFPIKTNGLSEERKKLIWSPKMKCRLIWKVRELEGNSVFQDDDEVLGIFVGVSCYSKMTVIFIEVQIIKEFEVKF